MRSERICSELPVGHWEYNLKRKETRISKEAIKIFGLGSKHEVYGLRTLILTVHPDDRRLFLQEILHCARHRKSATFEHRILRNYETVTCVLSSFEYMRGCSGKSPRILGRCYEMSATERNSKNYEEIINELREENEVIRKETVHRLKNALQGIVGLLELRVSDQAIGGARAITQQLKSLALVYELEGETASGGVRLMALVKKLWSLSKRIYESDGIDSIENDESDIKIQFAVPIAMALSELMTNAFKHRASEPPQIRVRYAGAAIEIRIENGIRKKESREEGGESFSRGGVGLKLVHKLLPRKGAALSIENTTEVFAATVKLETSLFNVFDRKSSNRAIISLTPASPVVAVSPHTFRFTAAASAPPWRRADAD